MRTLKAEYRTSAKIRHQQTHPEEDAARHEHPDAGEPQAPRHGEARLYLARRVVGNLDLLTIHPTRRRRLDFLAGEFAAELVGLAEFGAESGELSVRRGEDDDGEVVNPVARPLPARYRRSLSMAVTLPGNRMRCLRRRRTRASSVNATRRIAMPPSAKMPTATQKKIFTESGWCGMATWMCCFSDPPAI